MPKIIFQPLMIANPPGRLAGSLIEGFLHINLRLKKY